MHVALLVCLRLVAVTRPTKYKHTMAFKHRHKFTIGIWLVSISLGVLPIFCWYMERPHWQVLTKYIIRHGFHTFPVICIILMYAKLSIAIKRRKGQNDVESPTLNEFSKFFDNKLPQIDMKKKSPTKMIKRIIIALLVCVLPYIICWQYGSIVIIKRCPVKVYDFEVRGYLNSYHFLIPSIIVWNGLISNCT